MEKQEQQTYAICETKKTSIGHYKRHCCFGDYCENRLGMLNEYNKCMANKTINRWQCAIIWHTDDLKASHVEKKVVEDIIMQLNNKFGKESPPTTTCGKVLE